MLRIILFISSALCLVSAGATGTSTPNAAATSTASTSSTTIKPPAKRPLVCDSRAKDKFVGCNVR